MPTMENIDPSILFCMFKGEPGTRKSTQALSFPGPQYWFSFDRKMRGLNLPMQKWGIDPKTIEYDDYDSLDKARQKLTELQTTCKYKTIILDSVTSLADAVLRQTLRKKGAGGKGKEIAGIPVSSVEDFNAEAAALSEFVFLLKDIHNYHKVNVIMIAHVIQTEMRSLDGQTHMSRVIVTAAKKIAAKIPAYCDEVYHFNIKTGFVEGAGGSYALKTTHTGDDFARTTLPLPKEIEFNDDAIYDKYILPSIKQIQEQKQTVQRI